MLSLSGLNKIPRTSAAACSLCFQAVVPQFGVPNLIRTGLSPCDPDCSPTSGVYPIHHDPWSQLASIHGLYRLFIMELPSCIYGGLPMAHMLEQMK